MSQINYNIYVSYPQYLLGYIFHYNLMKSGLVAKVHGEFDDIDVNHFPIKRLESGDELKSSVDISDIVTNESGEEIITGISAEETFEKYSDTQIADDGQVMNGERRRQIVISTEFASVPGEFVVVESSSDVFALDLIGKATNTLIEPVTIDLDAFATEHTEDEYWMAGFYNHDGQAENGTAYGENIFSDSDLGQVVSDANKNQLGLDYQYRGESLRVRVTESGYVQVFQPSEWGTPSFIRYVNEQIKPFFKEADI